MNQKLNSNILRHGNEVNFFKNRIYTLTQLSGGAFTKMLQSLLDGSEEIIMLPAYPLLYFPQHWAEWSKKYPKLDNKLITKLLLKHHPSIIDTKRMTGHSGLANLGRNRNESIIISEKKFKKKFNYYLAQNEISLINTLISIHLAYACCGKIKINKNQIIFIHTHDVYTHTLLKKFFKNFKTIYCVRDTILNLHRRLNILEKMDEDRFDKSDREFTKNYHYFNMIQMWLADLKNINKNFFLDKNNLFIKYEQVIKNKEKYIRKVCSFLKIKYRKNIMSRMTFNSKEWSSDKIYDRKFTNKIRFMNTKDEIRDSKKNIFPYEIFVLEGVLRNLRKKFKYKNRYYNRSLLNNLLFVVFVFLPTKHGLSTFFNRINPVNFFKYFIVSFEEILLDSNPKNYYFSAFYKHKKPNKNMFILQYNFIRKYYFNLCSKFKKRNILTQFFVQYPFLILYFIFKIILYPYFFVEHLLIYICKCYLLIKNFLLIRSFS
tara:strand:- start:8102 stop:9562 length:1461 start_codon:yes stop_codon:yes gene_type:complete